MKSRNYLFIYLFYLFIYYYSTEGPKGHLHCR